MVKKIKTLLLFSVLVSSNYSQASSLSSFFEAGKSYGSNIGLKTCGKAAIGIAGVVACVTIIKQGVQYFYKKYNDNYAKKTPLQRLQSGVESLTEKKVTWWDYGFNTVVFLITAIISYKFVTSIPKAYGEFSKEWDEKIKENKSASNEKEKKNIDE